MCRPSHCRWLPAFAVFLALPVISSAQLVLRDNPPAPEENTPAVADLPSSTPGVEALSQLPHEDMGDIYTVRQRYTAALAEYMQVHSPTAATWNKMAIAYQMLFDSKDAIRCYKQSIRLNKHDARVYNNLGTVYDSLNRFKDGERYYRQSLKLDPQSALTLKNLGTNLLMQHKYEKGHEAYRQALSIDPGAFREHDGPIISDPASLHERGMANYIKALSCARAGLSDCALEYLRRAVNEGAVSAKALAAEGGFAPLRGSTNFQHLLAIAK